MADDPKLSKTYRRMHRGGIRLAKKTRERLASGDPKWDRHLKQAKKLGVGTKDMDRHIKFLEKEGSKLRKRAHGSKGGGGFPINPKLGGRDIGGRKPPWRKRRILE